MLCAPSNLVSYENGAVDFDYFRVLSVFSGKIFGVNSGKCYEYDK